MLGYYRLLVEKLTRVELMPQARLAACGFKVVKAGLTERYATQTSEVISGEVFACAPEDEVSEALATMQRRQVLRLPVVDRDGKLQGILSMNDILLRAAEGRNSAGDGISYTEVVNTRKVIGQHRNFRSEEGPSAGHTQPHAMRA
jgi:CBS domain-containing protein